VDPVAFARTPCVGRGGKGPVGDQTSGWRKGGGEERREKERRVHNFGSIKKFFHDRSFATYRSPCKHLDCPIRKAELDYRGN
jgi:hypothetical protein